MADMPFPPNSRASKEEPVPDKDIERVTSEDPVRRKKPLGKQFKETFAGGDIKSAMRYVVMEVLIPAAKDAVVDAGAQGFEKLIFGESRKRSRPSGAPGYVNYGRYSQGNDRPPMPNMRTISKRSRASHDFDEIVLVSRTEAETVVDRLYDLISRYDAASVADLYELVGIKSSHIDNQWGWTELHGSGVARVRNGFLLDLPEPESLK